MSTKNAIQIFDDKKVRTIWDESQEKWYISIIDVIEVLTNNERPRKYWSDLKAKLQKEGSEVSEKIGQLKMKAPDGKMRLTDEWKSKGIQEEMQFATLTDIITKTWADKTTKEYKILKGLKKENLRDNMTNTELILNMLAEASTKDISQAVNPKNFEESKKVARQGGNVAKVALQELEAQTGKKVVTSLNAARVLESTKQKKLK